MLKVFITAITFELFLMFSLDVSAVVTVLESCNIAKSEATSPVATISILAIFRRSTGRFTVLGEVSPKSTYTM